MRQIGHIDTDKDARVFCDYLYVQGIENEAERDGNRWSIWIHSDDDLPRARQMFDQFRANPADPRYLEGSPAQKLRDQEKKSQAEYQKRVIQGKALFPGLRNYGFGFVTYGFIAASVIVFVISNMGDNAEKIMPLFLTRWEMDGQYIRWLRGFQEVRHGEVWRLVTPVIVHFGIAHILFNMLWLRDLGSMFEARLSSWYFAIFIVVVATGSNLAQYLVAGPRFGGMSGVVYALIGYAWMRGRFDPGAGIALDRQSIMFALIWFVLCFTGLVGPIANAAHAAGLVLGAAWGFIDAKLKWRPGS